MSVKGSGQSDAGFSTSTTGIISEPVLIFADNSTGTSESATVRWNSEAVSSPSSGIWKGLSVITDVADCENPPTLILSSSSGSTCGTAPFTLSGNTFGGSATRVTITENGDGSVTPNSTILSPFSFTYTPKKGDIGKTVRITVTTNNPERRPCEAAIATFILTVNSQPAAPLIGTITHPTCSVPTGSVVLYGLPLTGTWTLTRNPGAVTTTGTGPITSITGLPAGTCTFTLTSSNGCTSSQSSNVVINAVPPSPASPTQTVDCTLGYGKAIVTVTSPLGAGFQYRLDGGSYQSGTSFVNVPNGSHAITVRNASGCTSTGIGFIVNCGCINPPRVTLGSSSGNTCGTTPVTISGNTFGGSATSVTITENGSGSVSPSSAGTSPFTFTYTPGAGDTGKTVTITVTTNNPAGMPCAAAVADYKLAVNTNPAAPSVGTITQPTCSVSTGSVVLSGLPAGSWTLTRTPGAVTLTGSGSSTNITSLQAGTYTYTVTSSTGCTSLPSAGIVINTQPATPLPPAAGTITSPTCTVLTGSVVMLGLPSTGTWTLTRYPGTITSTGTGTTRTISGLASGTYNFTVTNSAGCTSVPSANVVIPAQPAIPPAPVVGTITQPTYAIPTGSVVLGNLPSSGTWIITRLPGEVTTTGTGTSRTITGLPSGIFTFTVTNQAGCTSTASNVVIISTPGIPSLIITNPAPLCSPAETADLTAGEITSGSTPGLTYTYWINAGATIPYNSPATAVAGTYYIKGTTASGFFDVKPVIVTIEQAPLAYAGPDQILESKFETTLDAEPADYEAGTWSLVYGSGEFFDSSDPKTTVSKLSNGENILLWTVINGVCPSSSDQVSVTVRDLVIPTLITPNMDGKNDYFVLNAIEALGKTELVVFDRRGAQVYKNINYNNEWNGVDYNGKPLPDDTYFYVLKAETGRSISGYIVVRR